MQLAVSFPTPQDTQNTLQISLCFGMKNGGDLATSEEDVENPPLVLTVSSFFIWML